MYKKTVLSCALLSSMLCVGQADTTKRMKLNAQVRLYGKETQQEVELTPHKRARVCDEVRSAIDLSLIPDSSDEDYVYVMIEMVEKKDGKEKVQTRTARRVKWDEVQDINWTQAEEEGQSEQVRARKQRSAHALAFKIVASRIDDAQQEEGQENVPEA